MKSIIGFLSLGMRATSTGTMRLGRAEEANEIATGYGVNYGMAY